MFLLLGNNLTKNTKLSPDKRKPLPNSAIPVENNDTPTAAKFSVFIFYKAKSKVVENRQWPKIGCMRI